MNQLSIIHLMAITLLLSCFEKTPTSNLQYFRPRTAENKGFPLKKTEKEKGDWDRERQAKDA